MSTFHDYFWDRQFVLTLNLFVCGAFVIAKYKKCLNCQKQLEKAIGTLYNIRTIFRLYKNIRTIDFRTKNHRLKMSPYKKIRTIFRRTNCRESN